MKSIKQAHIVAEKNRPVYIDVPANTGVAKAELIAKDGSILKTYYSHLATANLPAGLVLFQDTQTQSGEVFLGSATVAIAVATAATAPEWVGKAAVTDKVIKVSVTGINKIASIGELVELRANDDMPPVTGRISAIGSGFVEISRAPVATDMSKLITFTSARAYLKIRSGRFGEPVTNPFYSLTVLNKNRAIVTLPTSFKMSNPHDVDSMQMLELDLAPFVRSDLIKLGTNTYGHSNVLFKVIQVQSDTSILIDLPNGFELSGGATSIVSDSSKQSYGSIYRSGNMGGNPASYNQVPVDGTTDVLKVDSVAAGASENDNVLCLIYCGNEIDSRYNNV